MFEPNYRKQCLACLAGLVKAWESSCNAQAYLQHFVRLPLHITVNGHKIKYELCVIVMIFDLSVCFSDFTEFSFRERPDDEPKKNKKWMRKEWEEEERKVRSIRKDEWRRKAWWMRSSILSAEKVFRVKVLGRRIVHCTCNVRLYSNRCITEWTKKSLTKWNKYYCFSPFFIRLYNP